MFQWPSNWSILHSFLDKHKIPKIPPIRHNNTFSTDILVKVNTFFWKQCSLIETDSEFPAEYLLTYYCLESVNLDPAKIISIICNFNDSKVHGWDAMSVRMVKICDESLVKPLFNIFQFLLETGNFPSNWKRVNINAVHKKNDKESIIIDQCPFSQSSAKFMKSISMIHFIITLRVMIYLLRVNPDFVNAILLCLSCCS